MRKISQLISSVGEDTPLGLAINTIGGNLFGILFDHI